MKNISIGLVQINNSFSGANYLPYSVGLLQAYANQHAVNPERYTYLSPIYKRIPVEDGVKQLKNAQVVGFSTYVWNIKLSLAIAKQLKEENPEILIIFGGPQVPDQSEIFLRDNSFIDICCNGEGEAVFLDILEQLPHRNWHEIPGVSFINPQQEFIMVPKGGRIKDMSAIPSPFLTGVFDPLMNGNENTHWLMLWETNRGCPFSCTFCDWGSATQSKVFQFDLKRLQAEMDWAARHKIEFIFCCDANFGILKRDLDLAQYVANLKEEKGYPHALSVQNTKNATDRAYLVQKILSDAGLNKGVTLSLQSIDKTTLKSIKRHNISLDTYQELQRRFTRDRVETYTDIILGLPGETYDALANGIAEVIANGQHNRIQFNNLAILPNAEMGNPAYQQAYGMEMVEVDLVNIHGSLEQDEQDIQETQELVIATAAMPRADWVKARTFCWMTALLHFDKVLQIPLLLLHHHSGISFRTLVEAFTEGDLANYPTLKEVLQVFLDKAEAIQNGDPEYSQSKDWLNIWWPTDEYVLIKLAKEDKLDRFYQEAEQLVKQIIAEHHIDFSLDLLHEAFRLNAGLLKRPFQSQDLKLELSANIWEHYRALLIGEDRPLVPTPIQYHIDRTTTVWNSWDEWCREVIWYGNKKGAYLYSSKAVTPQLSGHY